MHGAGRERPAAVVAMIVLGDGSTSAESSHVIILYLLLKHRKTAEQWRIAGSTPPPAPRTPSSTTRRKQYDEAGALVCAQRRNDVTRCNGIGMPPCGTLCANVTSSTTKPEVHYVSQRRKKRTESRLRAQELARRSEVQFRNVYIGF